LGLGNTNFNSDVKKGIPAWLQELEEVEVRNLFLIVIEILEGEIVQLK
jgi:hypothetical protein